MDANSQRSIGIGSATTWAADGDCDRDHAECVILRKRLMLQIPFLFGKSCHVNRVKHSVWQRVRLTGVPDWNHEMCEKKEQQRLNNSKLGDFNACVSSAPPPLLPRDQNTITSLLLSKHTHHFLLLVLLCTCYPAISPFMLPSCFSVATPGTWDSHLR